MEGEGGARAAVQKKLEGCAEAVCIFTAGCSPGCSRRSHRFAGCVARGARSWGVKRLPACLASASWVVNSPLPLCWYRFIVYRARCVYSGGVVVLKGYARETLTLQTRQRIWNEVDLLQNAQVCGGGIM